MGRFLEKVGWGGQLGGIQNQAGAFEKKCLVTLSDSVRSFILKHPKKKMASGGKIQEIKRNPHTGSFEKVYATNSRYVWVNENKKGVKSVNVTIENER